MTIALAQISPVFLDRKKTLEKVMISIREAADNDADLIVFGESLLPGYPF
jgi:nitrilase